MIYVGVCVDTEEAEMQELEGRYKRTVDCFAKKMVPIETLLHYTERESNPRRLLGRQA